MPKFITYQRPAPVNKAGWGGGKPDRHPYQPLRRPPLPPVQPGLPSPARKAK
jgi:hypothetical protein